MSIEPTDISKERRDLVVRAALELAASGELGEQTMKRVAAKARMSLSTVYSLVGSKHELLLLVARTMQEQATQLASVAGVGERGEGGSVAYALAPMLASYEIFTADLAVGREIVAAGALHDHVRVYLNPDLEQRPDVQRSVTVLSLGYFGVLSARLAEMITDEQGRDALRVIAEAAFADSGAPV